MISLITCVSQAAWNTHLRKILQSIRNKTLCWTTSFTQQSTKTQMNPYNSEVSARLDSRTHATLSWYRKTFDQVCHEKILEKIRKLPFCHWTSNVCNKFLEMVQCKHYETLTWQVQYLHPKSTSNVKPNNQLIDHPDKDKYFLVMACSNLTWYANVDRRCEKSIESSFAIKRNIAAWKRRIEEKFI